MTEEIFEDLEEGEKILFNDRKTPLEVAERQEDGSLTVEGPGGGEYEIYRAEDDEDVLLVSRKGNRRYSSYCEDLRRVGEWVREDENLWKHSKTDARIELVKNENGFWTIKSDKFEDELDLPKYGYSSREFAEEDVEKFVKNNPEG